MMLRQKAGAEFCFQEVAVEFDRRAEFDAAGVFKDLDFDFFSGDFDHFAF
jgi:hypothetical protein